MKYRRKESSEQGVNAGKTKVKRQGVKFHKGGVPPQQGVKQRDLMQREPRTLVGGHKRGLL